MPSENQPDFPSLETGFVPDKNEGLFARDVDGRLIRAERAQLDDLNRKVTLTVDGQTITVNKALPERDSQGNIRRKDDQPIPRNTTIYDAVNTFVSRDIGAKNPIPTLCHREHLPPVGVCRVCLVALVDGSRVKLVPACKQIVEDGMEVHTLDSPVNAQYAQRVRSSVRTIVELLASDHLPEENRGVENELEALANRVGARTELYASATQARGKDLSSHMINVDHEQCIMCGRCIRGCNYVKHNDVIGRTNKGFASRIAFDLDMPMLESDCVSCGECAISCPTGAMQFDETYLATRDESILASEAQRTDTPTQGSSQGLLSPQELREIPLFSGIPYKFLQFNASCVVRRHLKAGEVLCREGEYGATAFVIEAGTFQIDIESARGVTATNKRKGWLGFLGGLRTKLVTQDENSPRLADLSGTRLDREQPLLKTKEDLILGEMSCMNRYPRSATVTAVEDSQVLEIRRNVLFMLQRNESSRTILESTYRDRALVGKLEGLDLLAGLSDEERCEAARFLSEKVELISVDPGQRIFEQGDVANEFYVVRLGHVKISQRVGDAERVINYLRPGREFGEIGLILAAFPDLIKSQEGQPELQAGIRTASCSALDHVELIRLDRKPFMEMLQTYPAIAERLIASSEEAIERDRRDRNQMVETQIEALVEQGLHQAQSLLVLDLDRCTRCDECTKACADTHDGVTRLIRDGMRFDHFLVASSCRSCLDPHCLIGCPVDAIHRNGDSLEIQIESYCIGCGLCADNCPYGNINMHGFADRRANVIQYKATTCDLCASLDSNPSCVYACPHNAAFRMSGAELWESTGGQVAPPGQ